MSHTQTPMKLCQWNVVTLEHDLTLDNGSIISAGTDVLLVPQTTSTCVMVEGGKSLADILPTLSINAVETGAQAIRLTDRLTRIEMQLVSLLAWACKNGYTE